MTTPDTKRARLAVLCNYFNDSYMDQAQRDHGHGLSLKDAVTIPTGGVIASAQITRGQYNDEPGDPLLLLSNPYKVLLMDETQPTLTAPNNVIITLSNQMDEISKYHLGVKYEQLMNTGIAYWNCICNCRHHAYLERFELKKAGHTNMKIGLCALVLHAVAYGWTTAITKYESLSEKHNAHDVDSPHYTLVMPLLAYMCRFMDPYGDLDWQKVLHIKLQQFIEKNRKSMLQGGLWSVNQVVNEITKRETRGWNRKENIKDKYVSGVRYEFARMLVHLAPPGKNGFRLHEVRDPTTGKVESQKGACMENERNCVLNKTSFDETHGWLSPRPTQAWLTLRFGYNVELTPRHS